jgi:hypothetical protein
VVARRWKTVQSISESFKDVGQVDETGSSLILLRDG